jgi:ATP-dependent 26S proteasome regulatory subunit
MSVERDIRFDLIARLCPNATGAELKSVATEVSGFYSQDTALSLPHATNARMISLC